MAKRKKTFYRAIARVRAIGNKDGAVRLRRLKSKLGLGYVRAARLKDELVEAEVLREWNEKDFRGLPKKGKREGNINWKNLSRFRVPKEITQQEVARVKKERKKGLI